MSRPSRPLRHLALLTALLLPLSACSPGSTDSPGATAGTSSASADSTATQTMTPTADCQRSLTGSQTIDITFEGVTYPVQVDVPQDADPATALPLVLDLHGSDANATIQGEISGLAAVAEQDATGFVVARPNGAIALETQNPLPDGNWAWNVPGVPTTAGQMAPDDARDDIAFLAAVIDEVSELACVDSSRVYATGYSGGGRMSSALACARPDLIAAIAPVAGLRAGRGSESDPSVIDTSTCTPDQPVSVITFHGTDDPVNPMDGNDDLRWGYTTQAALARWAQINGLTDDPVTSEVSEHVTLTAYTSADGSAEVQLYTVAGGGHTWPGTSWPPPADWPTTQEINASELMWQFFSEHPRR